MTLTTVEEIKVFFFRIIKCTIVQIGRLIFICNHPEHSLPNVLMVKIKKGEHTSQGVLNIYIGNTFDYDNVYPILDWQAINGITVEHDIPLECCNDATFPWILLSFVGGVSDGQYGLAMMMPSWY